MKKVMVISFDSINLSSSNGRSLGSILKLAESEISFSQIYIKGSDPDIFDGQYCFISEKKLLKTFFNVKRSTNIFEFHKGNNSEKNIVSDNRTSNKIKKTPFKMLLRNIMWSFASINMKTVFKWALNISPDYVIVQAGDLPYLLSLSVKIARKCNSKVIFYTSENYPFKKDNYTNLNKKSIIYPLLQRKLYKATKQVVRLSSSCIFLTESLLDEYSKNYSLACNSYVIYPYSTVSQISPKPLNKENITLSYCGNLSLDRYKTIINIASVVYSKYPGSKIIVCGNASTKIIDKLKEQCNIQYRGLVPYEEVIKVYRESDYLLHVESFDSKIANDSRHAFSGKISDCIASCRPFIFVGPDTMFEYSFLLSNRAALVFGSLNKFNNFVKEGGLEKNDFDPTNQLLVKNSFFSFEETKRKIFEVLEL